MIVKYCKHTFVIHCVENEIVCLHNDTKFLCHRSKSMYVKHGKTCSASKTSSMDITFNRWLYAVFCTWHSKPCKTRWLLVPTTLEITNATNLCRKNTIGLLICVSCWGSQKTTTVPGHDHNQIDLPEPTSICWQLTGLGLGNFSGLSQHIWALEIPPNGNCLSKCACSKEC